MNCTDIAELAPLHLAGELDAERATAFAAHCEICPKCGAELSWRQQLDARLRDSFPQEAVSTAQLERRVREAIAAEAPALRPRAPRRWALAAIGVAAVLLLASLTYRYLLGSRVPPVFADAALDHQAEVVQQQPRSWRTEASEVSALAEKRGIPESAIASLQSGSYRLKGVRLCYLDNQIFLHMVFVDGNEQFSVFLRRGHGQSIAATPREQVNGRQIYTAKSQGEGVAALETADLTAVVVGGPSLDSALRVARFVAAKL